MMSLVGCSGDEFSSILKSLGFSAQKRKAPEKPGPSEPLADAPAGAASASASEAAPAGPAPEAATTDAAKQAEPDGTASEAGSQTLPADAPAPATDTATAVANASETGTPGSAAAETPATPEAAPAEPEMIDVWWPKDTGPFRQHRQQHANRPKGAKGNAGKPPRNRPQKGAGSKKSSGPHKPPHRKEKPIDPNSPFAVLGQLKQALTKK